MSRVKTAAEPLVCFIHHTLSSALLLFGLMMKQNLNAGSQHARLIVTALANTGQLALATSAKQQLSTLSGQLAQHRVREGLFVFVGQHAQITGLTTTPTCLRWILQAEVALLFRKPCKTRIKAAAQLRSTPVLRLLHSTPSCDFSIRSWWRK